MIDPQEIGYYLLKRGFKDWFLYMFRVIENRPFVFEPIHEDLFKTFDDIYNQKTIRQIINLPPRSAKSTLCKYFIIYTLTINPKCNWIYTSYSQALLSGIASEMAAILENPIYQAMYPANRTQIEEQEIKPLDEFWAEYVQKETGKNVYSSKKIVTYAGGVILFASAGGQITGFGAGIRNYNGFSGGLIMDDFDKPADVRSETMRKKYHEYISQTLMSRLNNSSVFMGCVAQRLHIDDTSGFLQTAYNFNILKKPLLNEKEECQIPSQYTPERIKELQVDNYAFQSQYQQEPILLGGGIIRHEWWRFYSVDDNCRYKRMFITADTANKTKEWNDYTAIGVWGVTTTNRLRLLDMVHAKLEITELQATLVALWQKWQHGIGMCRCTAIYIEDKASGTQVIQQLRRQGGLPILPYTPEKDKLARVQDAIPQIAAGNVELPESDQHPMSRELIAEADAFSGDFSHLHDDMIDMTTMAIAEAFTTKGYF